jgi:hypothetical protein
MTDAKGLDLRMHYERRAKGDPPVVTGGKPTSSCLCRNVTHPPWTGESAAPPSGTDRGGWL